MCNSSGAFRHEKTTLVIEYLSTVAGAQYYGHYAHKAYAYIAVQLLTGAIRNVHRVFVCRARYQS
jgi:hypothetical protein